MNDISEILRELLDRYGNSKMLDDEFSSLLRSDTELNNDYKLWCNAHGYNRKSGYREFIDELVDSQYTLWDQYKEFGNDI